MTIGPRYVLLYATPKGGVQVGVYEDNAEGRGTLRADWLTMCVNGSGVVFAGIYREDTTATIERLVLDGVRAAAGLAARGHT